MVRRRKCSRYQFECRTSGECIAIYNACDGIPQCADASDEGPELACPSPVSTVPPPPPAPPSIVVPQHGQPEGPQNFNPQFRQPPAQPMWPAASWQQQQPPKSPADFAQQPSPVQHPQQLNPAQASYQQPMQQQQVPPEPRKFYSREGDYGGVHDSPAQWPAQQFQNPGPMNPVPQTFHRPGTYPGAEYEDPQNSHIFNHKGGVLLNDPDGGSSGYGGYGAAEKPGGSYYNGVGPGFHQPQAQPPQHEQQQWQRPRISSQDHETLLGHSVEDELRLGSHAHFGAPPLQPPSSQQQAPVPVGVAPDYYNYEEGGPQQRFHHHQMHQQPPLLKVQHRPPALMEGQSEAIATVEAPSKPHPALDQQRAPASPEHPQVTLEKVAHSNSHYSGEGSKKKALPPHMPPPLDPEALQFPDGSAAKPGGAYLSLSVGLTVTALLVVLISCRLRVVRRRLRRGGGKSPYAHDADFLVNGMYL
ncbi:hypothetical protein B566_EDAN001319 [Ephemera danica]|nr:hypothetical protein B566_EDAN001319 [Ephemera danica]